MIWLRIIWLGPSRFVVISLTLLLSFKKLKKMLWLAHEFSLIFFFHLFLFFIFISISNSTFIVLKHVCF